VDELGARGRGAVVSRPAQYKALHAGHDAGVGVN
jgi:lactate dehydrogenase-like 2-hydroxyacid dehydrogenase